VIFFFLHFRRLVYGQYVGNAFFVIDMWQLDYEA